MNYRKVYMAIIANALKEQRIKKSKDAENYVYYEAHHILPKSLFPAWINRKSNLVLLTAREHYFCHQLLTKIWRSREMANALFRMTTSKVNNHLIISSRDYEYSRKLFVELHDFAHGMEAGKFKWFNNGKKKFFHKSVLKDIY